jgi:hypothetical protein
MVPAVLRVMQEFERLQAKMEEHLARKPISDLIDLGITLYPPKVQHKQPRKPRSTDIPQDIKLDLQDFYEFIDCVYAILASDFGMTYWPGKELMLHPRELAVRELCGVDSGEAFVQIVDLLEMQLTNRERERKRLRRKISSS